MTFEGMFKGADRALIDELRDHREVLAKGKILVIDPSSLSMGYALIEGLKIIDNGVVKFNQKKPIAGRLGELVVEVQKRWPDIQGLAVEKIRGSRAHIYLLWAVGATVAAAKCPLIFEVPNTAWKKMRGDGYIKNDSQDAKMMGEFIIKALE